MFASVEQSEGDGALFSPMVAASIQKDGAKPGEELATAIVASNAFPGLEQRILGEVFSQRRVAAKGRGLPHKAAFMRSAKLAKESASPCCASASRLGESLISISMQ